jgi:hypothetical protein
MVSWRRWPLLHLLQRFQPLIVGGPQPEGYVYVGSHHHVGTIWGSMDTVAVSMMETRAAGNDEGM